MLIFKKIWFLELVIVLENYLEKSINILIIPITVIIIITIIVIIIIITIVIITIIDNIIAKSENDYCCCYCYFIIQ